MILSLSNANFNDYKVVDVDTGKIIDFVSYANDVVGEYNVFVRDELGRVKVNGDKGAMTEIKKGNIKFIKRDK